MKNPFLSILTILFLLFLVSCNQESYKEVTKTDSSGYTYTSVTNDPMGVRMYTLENGLKVYLSRNPEKPRIQTFIAVRAGSTFDPPDNTGLAHYLEHLMFKGTSEIGTVNWEKEKIELQKISDLYEEHKATSDPQEKRLIYAKIDSISQVACQYAVASEYDKMVGKIGASGTNAFTSNEMTVYINDIPSNELNKWLTIESERFSELVLRLFHTELETVYEEFNMSQDNDYRKAYFKLFEELFPTHPYGQQTTIGKAEHLKNPSMKSIYNYWKTYYVPNNMAVCLSGDFDYDEAIASIDKTFGQYEPSEVPEYVSPVEQPITSVKEFEVVGPDVEFVMFAYRFDGIDSEDKKYVDLISRLLSNNTAGSIDINLVQEQKVLRAGSYPYFHKHYGMHFFYGYARQDQPLEEVRDLLLAELDKIKNGEFEDWMLEAVVNDFRLNETLGMENNWRGMKCVEAFIYDQQWKDQLAYFDALETITKEQIVDFAGNHYADNYVLVYKRNGQDTVSVKVEKPQITPVKLNRDTISSFHAEFEKMESERLSPQFVDFENDLEFQTLAEGVELTYLKNEISDIFRLYVMFDIGTDNSKKLSTAIRYVPYLGTSKYSPKELKQELYRHGLKLNTRTMNDNSALIIYGINKSFEKGLELVNHILDDVQPDQEAYDKYVEGIFKERENSKLDKWNILTGGMMNYAQYGPVSSFTNHLTNEELKQLDPAELTDLIHNLKNYNYRLVYCGNGEKSVVATKAQTYIDGERNILDVPTPIQITEQDQLSDKVYFVDYDMVQAMVILLAKDQMFDPEILPVKDLFNEYYGSGLSSIVFQEIREARGLAYSAFASYFTPPAPDKSHFIFSFLSTQPDKLQEATGAIKELMSEMPRSEIQFDGCKQALLKKIESDRRVNMSLFWHYDWHRKMGIEKDNREQIYNFVQNATLDEIDAFFKEHVKKEHYTYLVLGNKKMIDQNLLATIGEVEILSLDEIFNY